MTRDVEQAPSGRLGRDRKQFEDERPRVLFIDSSVVSRTYLKELFRHDEALEAFSSHPAIDVIRLNIARARPHLAVLDADRDWEDVAMILSAVRSEYPELPFVLITAQGSAQKGFAQNGRAFGVRACWLKSNGFGQPDAAVRQYLTSQMEAVLGIGTKAGSGSPSSESVSSVRSSAAVPSRAAVDSKKREAVRPRKKMVIVIGVSTGGPEALSVLLPLLPADLSIPVLIVQHTLAAFTKLLVERLQKKTALAVSEAGDGMTVSGGEIVVAPGNRHMRIAVRNGHLVTLLDDGPPENSCRPAVDPLFKSAAHVYGAQVLGVILTGMGQDGLAGCRELKQAGGTVLAQDEASSTVWGMPGQVAQAGLADKILDLAGIAQEITRQVGVGSRVKSA